MQLLIDDFIVYISSEKGLSNNTIEAYSRDLNRFVEFLERLGKKEIKKISEDEIVLYLSKLKEKNFEPSSLARTLVSIKVFFKFLKRENHIEINPAYYLNNPKLWQAIPNILSIEEVETLFKMPVVEEEEGCRSVAIMELLYATGIRVSELVLLDLYDISDTFIKVKGKGGKERVTPLGCKALKAIDDYLNRFRCRYESDKQKALFVTCKGKRMNRQMIWKMIKRYIKQAGICKTISPHSLRHSFATHLVDNGAEIRVVQEMMGHASISSTDRYMHVSQTKLQEAFHLFHPRIKA